MIILSMDRASPRAATERRLRLLVGSLGVGVVLLAALIGALAGRAG